jgi:hypothetical protein
MILKEKGWKSRIFFITLRLINEKSIINLNTYIIMEEKKEPTYPTYPFDRKLLELIMALTETESLVNLDKSSKALGSTYDIISEKVSQGAYEYVSGEIKEAKERPDDYKPTDMNSWKRVFGHNDLGKGSKCMGKLLIQIPYFLEFDSWDELMKGLEELHKCVVEEKRPRRKVEEVSVQTPYTSFSHLRPGDELDVYWPKSSKYEAPGEACMKIRYLGSYGTYGAPKFHINAVQNCSLEVGEDFDAQCMEEGMKIMLTNRRLNNRHKGNYVSGQAVTSILIFRKKDC